MDIEYLRRDLAEVRKARAATTSLFYDNVTQTLTRAASLILEDAERLLVRQIEELNADESDSGRGVSG